MRKVKIIAQEGYKYSRKKILKDLITEAVVRRFSVEKVFLKILQNSQESTCARFYFLIKLQALDLQLY